MEDAEYTSDSEVTDAEAEDARAVWRPRDFTPEEWAAAAEAAKKQPRERNREAARRIGRQADAMVARAREMNRRVQGREPSVSLARPPEKVGSRWGAFISHYKAEAAAEARLLQDRLEAQLGEPCFLDSDDLRDLRELQQSVRDSRVLLLVQSASVLTRPFRNEARPARRSKKF